MHRQINAPTRMSNPTLDAPANAADCSAEPSKVWATTDDRAEFIDSSSQGGNSAGRVVDDDNETGKWTLGKAAVAEGGRDVNCFLTDDTAASSSTISCF
jgi:hypothetical protein